MKKKFFTNLWLTFHSWSPSFVSGVFCCDYHARFFISEQRQFPRTM
jgi:hypothetical protein